MAMEGLLFGRLTTTSVILDVLDRYTKRADRTGPRFVRVIKKMRRDFFRIFTDFIWEKIVEGDEFIFPNMRSSLIIVETKSRSFNYRRKFYQQRSVFVELREYPTIINMRTRKLRGRLSKKGIAEVNKRMENGLRYTKRTSKYVEKKYRK